MKACVLTGCLLAIPLAAAVPILPTSSASGYGLPGDTGYPPVPSQRVPVDPVNDPYDQFPQAQPNTLQPGRNRCMGLKARSFSFGTLVDIWKNPAKYSTTSHDCSGGSSNLTWHHGRGGSVARTVPDVPAAGMHEAKIEIAADGSDGEPKAQRVIRPVRDVLKRTQTTSHSAEFRRVAL
ncbi:hypothetical protein PpBr36_00899 [Pyricularia pennisetigena]|uniref:hypothetical protein n=1 Tax=Pyricularia pennisetigena TaxID=1578925 RepID=UPI0011514642|nr:hypothetical protein PpBr36_00899 [Pyricularia pennisetigena]TLS28001.1 hypothetical protein PpBr36_00899 [Pyricularia pennisetigena]